MAQAVECLPSKGEALSSNPRIANKQNPLGAEPQEHGIEGKEENQKPPRGRETRRPVRENWFCITWRRDCGSPRGVSHHSQEDREFSKLSRDPRPLHRHGLASGLSLVTSRQCPAQSYTACLGQVSTGRKLDLELEGNSEHVSQHGLSMRE
jgi:hypothetical protein